jgi:AcrR family transcriptional regulator
MRDTKAQLIDVSISLIFKVGYAHFSLGLLAKEMNVSKGVVNYHFPQKELLLTTIVQDFYADTAAYMAQHMETNGTSLDALKSYIEANLDFVLTQPVRVLAVIDILANSRQEDGTPLFPNDGSIYKPLIEIFTYGQTVDHQFRQFDPLLMAQLVRAAIDMLAQSLAKGEHSNPKAAIQQVVTTFEFATRRDEI